MADDAAGVSDAVLTRAEHGRRDRSAVVSPSREPSSKTIPGRDGRPGGQT